MLDWRNLNILSAWMIIFQCFCMINGTITLILGSGCHIRCQFLLLPCIFVATLRGRLVRKMDIKNKYNLTGITYFVMILTIGSWIRMFFVFIHRNFCQVRLVNNACIATAERRWKIRKNAVQKPRSFREILHPWRGCLKNRVSLRSGLDCTRIYPWLSKFFWQHLSFYLRVSSEKLFHAADC